MNKIYIYNKKNLKKIIIIYTKNSKKLNNILKN